MTDIEIIDLTPENIADYVCGYKDVEKHLELRRKIDWFKEYYPKGLRIKAILSKKGGYQGILEYIPGKYAHRSEVISHHPISNTRFENIMAKRQMGP
jgi:hypothetical protein